MSADNTVKELPSEERPYEKCMALGPQALSDAELLAIIIRTGSKGEGCVELCRKILNLSNFDKSILGINHLSTSELMKIKGIGKVKAVQIKCIAELSRRISKAKALDNLCFRTPETIAEYYMEDVRHEEQEHLILVMLNTKNKFLGDRIMSKGTVNASLVSPREIFIEALNKSAVYIIMVHNHPSGDPTPSRNDLKITRQLKEAGNIVGIQLIDHIIIGDNRYISFNEKGLL